MRSFLLGQKTEVSTAVPYIETDGVASYMDLGFVPTAEFKCDVQFKFESVKHSTNAQYNRAFGADNSNLPTGWHYSIGIGGSPSVVNIVNPMFTTSIQWNTKVRVEIDSDIIVDGEVVQSGITKNAAVSTMKVGCSMPSNASTFGNARIYSAKFWESGVLIRDLVPYSGPRGVGMLDKVNDVLYANASTTGSLTYGEEPASFAFNVPFGVERHVPSRKTPYIETDGVASYIDLGFVPTGNTEYELCGCFSEIPDSDVCGLISASGGLKAIRFRIRCNKSGGNTFDFANPTWNGCTRNALLKSNISYRSGEIRCEDESHEVTSTLIPSVSLKIGTTYVSDAPYYLSKKQDILRQVLGERRVDS